MGLQKLIQGKQSKTTHELRYQEVKHGYFPLAFSYFINRREYLFLGITSVREMFVWGYVCISFRCRYTAQPAASKRLQNIPHVTI